MTRLVPKATVLKENDCTIDNAATKNNTEHNPSTEEAINNSRTGRDQKGNDASISMSATINNNEGDEGSTRSTGSNKGTVPISITWPRKMSPKNITQVQIMRLTTTVLERCKFQNNSDNGKEIYVNKLTRSSYDAKKGYFMDGFKVSGLYESERNDRNKINATKDET